MKVGLMGQLSQKEQDAITKTLFQNPDAVRGEPPRVYARKTRKVNR
jgi:hypothetical protein